MRSKKAAFLQLMIFLLLGQRLVTNPTVPLTAAVQFCAEFSRAWLLSGSFSTRSLRAQPRV